jgi:hypothetical protein
VRVIRHYDIRQGTHMSWQAQLQYAVCLHMVSPSCCCMRSSTLHSIRTLRSVKDACSPRFYLTLYSGAIYAYKNPAQAARLLVSVFGRVEDEQITPNFSEESGEGLLPHAVTRRISTAALASPRAQSDSSNVQPISDNSRVYTLLSRYQAQSQRRYAWSASVTFEIFVRFLSPEETFACGCLIDIQITHVRTTWHRYLTGW